jgi:hypothetical protein
MESQPMKSTAPVRDLNKIQSEANLQAEQRRGVANANESAAFCAFTRTMQVYPAIIDENTTLALSTESDLFTFRKGMNLPQDE